MSNIISLTTDTNKAERNVHPLVRSWAIDVHALYKDGSRPIYPGDPRRDEYARYLAPIRPHFDIDEPGENGAEYYWEPDVLGRFYLQDITKEKLPAYPLTPTWAEKVDITLDYDHGVCTVSFESKEYAPPRVQADDGCRISITFLQTICVVFDPSDPKFNRDTYPAVVGAVQTLTPISVYPNGIESSFLPEDMQLLATALQECARDALAAADPELSDVERAALSLVVHLPGDMRKSLRYVTADDLDAKGDHDAADRIRPYENFEAALRAGALKGVI